MRGFSPFVCKKQCSPEFGIFLKENEILPEKGEILYEFEADGVKSFFREVCGGHLLEMTDAEGRTLSVRSQAEERGIFLAGVPAPQMLRFALWMAYGLMTAGSGRIAIHGSCIVKDGLAYLFLGESGTGKSTHTRLWRENIPGAALLNDDSPIVVAEDGGVSVYGSPWSGKTPCHKQEHYPLAACVRLSQAPYNKIEKLPPLKAYGAIHPSCPPEFAYSSCLYDGISRTLDRLLSGVPVYHLACLPDRDAAILSYETLSGNHAEKDPE